MGKELFIAEKPSVAKEFAKTLGVNGNAGNGYLESQDYVVTWCVGHLVKEQLIFPEIEYDKVDKVRGMDIIVVTTAETDEEARELLAQFGMPFKK